MSARRVFWPLIITAVLFAADPSWKTKPISDWSEQDAHQILTDSPWAGTVMAIISPLPTEDQRREGGNMGLPHGIGYDGFPDTDPDRTSPGILSTSSSRRALFANLSIMH